MARFTETPAGRQAARVPALNSGGLHISVKNGRISVGPVVMNEEQVAELRKTLEVAELIAAEQLAAKAAPVFGAEHTHPGNPQASYTASTCPICR
jgi:hypothetical protein